MRQHPLTFTFCWALWFQCCFCMPISTSTSQDLSFVIRYGWPKEVFYFMRATLSIPEEAYTDKQANDFVTNGMTYFARVSMDAPQLFVTMGTDMETTSLSFVYGTDDSSKAIIKKRWRWLPLIEGFDNEGKPIFHTSTWSNGETMRSMDLLRVDYYRWQNVQFCLPTAIVRPIQRGKTFGRGLQFTTVYEFPTSFAHFLRQPSPHTAKSFQEAVLKASQQWFSSVRSRSLAVLNAHYQMLTPDMIYRGMRTTFAQPVASSAAKKPSTSAIEERLQPVRFAPLSMLQDLRAAGPHLQPSGNPVARLEPVNTNPPYVGGSAFAEPRPLGGFATDRRLPQWTGFPFAYTSLHQGTSRSSEEPSTVLQLGRGGLDSQASEPLFRPVHPFAGDDWLHLGNGGAESSENRLSARAQGSGFYSSSK